MKKNQFSHLRMAGWLQLIAIAFLLPVTMVAQAGSLDSTFSQDGKLTQDLGNEDESAEDVAVEPDGKILVVGYSRHPDSAWAKLHLLRYLVDGTLDASFDGDGMVTLDAPVYPPFTIALPGSGKILVGADVNGDYGAIRFNSDGSLDSTFDQDGIATHSFLSLGSAMNKLVVQPDGKILLGGYANTFTSYWRFAIVRFNEDGSLDSTFDGDGQAESAIFTFASDNDIVLQPDGKIVASGEGGNECVVIRWNADGSLDSTFGQGGEVYIPFSGHSEGFTLALQADGKLLTGGYSVPGWFDRKLSLARVNADGSLDNSFNGNGMLITSYSSARKLAIQSDGRILVVGTVGGFAVLRYTSTGSPDTTFSGDGFAGMWMGPFGSAFGDKAQSLVVQPDGKIVVVGAAQEDGFMNFAIARFNSANSMTREDEAMPMEMLVFPNPANEKLIVATQVALDWGSLKLMDALGRVVDVQIRYGGNTQEIDVAPLPEGIYLLHVQSGDQEFTRRIIKQD